MLKTQTMTYLKRRAGVVGGAGRLLGLLAGAVSLALVLSGCSGCSEEEAPCAGVVCERGECSASSGQCVNPAACGEDSPACLEGFACDEEEARCIAAIPCADNVPCERGVCRAGACVDPPSCESDDSCVPTSYCDLNNGTCAPDPCANGMVSCERGLCDRIAGACVNESVCTTQNEETNCLEGFRCLDRACVNVQSRCDALNCQRGVCSFELNICDDAPSCESDRDCLASRYCGDDNTCQTNVCNGVDQECARGVCEASTGECVNPPSCSTSAQCVDDNICVSDVCVPTSQACGEEGCPGNQTCNYDPETRVAQCGEPVSGACSASLDCADDRICRAGRCQASVACEPDALEPNDTPDDATSYASARTAAGVNATLCAGDVDLFTFDTSSSPNETGRLIVNLDLNPEDRGLGALKLELLSPSGDVLAQATTDAQGRARVGQEMSAANQGVYTIRVSDSGDVRESGARYNVFAKVADSAVVQACSAPRALMQGQPVFSRTTSAPSSSLAMSCADSSGAVPEDIYAITITERAFVTLTMTPESSADLAISLRADCLSDGSELASACADDAGDGAAEEISALVEPGTYFAVVQADRAADGGFYELALRVNPTICSARDNACADEDTARVCNARGTGFDDIGCSNGCDMLTGACNPPVGDSCAAPRVLMLDTPQSLFIDWNTYTNSYDPGPSGCVPASATGSPTAGPDVAFALEVPAQSALIASLSDTGRDVAMYVVTDCDDLANTCLAAANAGNATNERLLWINDSAQTASVVLIVAVEPGLSYVSSELIVEARAACTPGEIVGCSADGTSLQACGSEGTVETLACDDAGCMNDACVNPGGRACFDAIVLSGQAGSEQGGWTGDDNLQLGAGRYHGQCVIPGGLATLGADTFYTIELQAGELFEASLATTLTTAYLMFFEDCTDTDTCVANNPRRGATTLRYYAEQPVTLSVVVDNAESASSPLTYTLNWNVSTGLSCAPGQTRCLDATTMVVCDDDGMGSSQVICAGGCAGRGCQLDPVTSNSCADVLADPSDIGDGISLYGSFAELTSSLSFTATASCAGGVATPGPDAFLKVVLEDDEVLEVSAEVYGSARPLIYIISDCSATAASCVSGAAGSTTTYTGQAFYLNDSGAPETLLVGLDTTSAMSTGFFSLAVGKGAPECVPGDRQCDVTGQDAQVCNSFGRFERVTCDAGCMSGRCILPPGDVCSDPIALTSGVPEVVDLSIYNIDHTRIFSACPGGGSSNGKDVVFSISASAGDVLTIVMDPNPSFDAVLTIVNSCDPVTDTAGACLAGRDSGNPERLTYVAPADGDYLIIASAYGATATVGPFTLTATVDTPSCMPDTTLGCSADGLNLEVCDSFGVVRTTLCSANGCMNDACVPPPGDTCSDAIVVTPGVPEQGNLALYGINHTRASSSCPNSGSGSSSGKDAVYTVSVQAGDVIDITLASSFDSVITITDSCDTTTNQVGACLAGRDQGQPERLSFVAPAAGDYFIIASAYSSFTTTGTFTITINAGAPSCTPDTVIGCLPDGDTLEVCSSVGIPTSVSCANGCVNDACVLPAGDVCTNAIPLMSGVPYSGNTADYDIDHGDESDECLGAYGADTVFVISAQMGQTIEVDYFSSFDGVVWLTNTCSATGTIGLCLDGADNELDNDTESFSFVAPQTGDYYIVGAPYEFFDGGSFTITATVQ